MATKPTRLLSKLRTPESDPSRGSVLDGALAAFVDLGIRRTSMGDIAKRTGISPATLYRRFPGKNAVIEAVGMREVRRLLADADDLLADLRHQGADADTQLTELTYAVIDGIRRNRLLQRVLRTEPETVLPLLTVHGGPVLALGREYLTEYLDRLQADGDIPAIDSEPVAELMARIAISLTLTPETTIPLQDPDRARAFIRTVLTPAVTQRIAVKERPAGGAAADRSASVAGLPQ